MDTDKARELFKDLSNQLGEIKTVGDEIKRDAFERRMYMLIREFFTEESEYLRDINKISWYDLNSYDDYESMEAWDRGWHKSNNLINTILEDIDIQSTKPKVMHHHVGSTEPLTNKVFVVHGHDDAMKQAVARTLSTLKLDPIILHEQPSKGKTIIEKISDYADVSFVVVLLSGDDIGYSKTEGPEAAKSRARQNVILELGFFLGILGRAAVIALHQPIPGFEIPTDYSGVIFIPYDQYESWKFTLVKELQAFGFNVDANDLTKPK